MISYVLVMIVSLATGEPTHASLEGPMSKSWCEQLITQHAYSGTDATSRRMPACLSEPDAYHILQDNFCTRSPGPSQRWPRIEFDCAAPAAAPAAMSPTAALRSSPAAQPPTSEAASGTNGTPGEAGTASVRTLPLPDDRAVAVQPGSSATSGARELLSGPAAPASASDDSQRAGAATEPVGAGSPTDAGAGSAQALPITPGSPAGPAEPPVPGLSEAEPEPLPATSERHFRLGTAARALVARAHAQAGGGHYTLAAATIERALRIEPENPLLWIELGEARMREGHPGQADGLYRKALELAAGDSEAQATAWLLLAESLRRRGRNLEAADAERRAASAVPR